MSIFLPQAPKQTSHVDRRYLVISGGCQTSVRYMFVFNHILGNLSPKKYRPKRALELAISKLNNIDHDFKSQTIYN